MRILGALIIVVGLILTLTIFGAVIGIPLMLVGLLIVVLGGRTVVTNVVHVYRDGRDRDA